MMWFWKTDPQKTLQKEYDKLTEEAMILQRNGKIPEFAKKTAQANKVLEELQALG